MSAAAASADEDAGDQEAGDDQPRQVDAEVPRRPRVRAHDPQPQAQGRPRQHVVDDEDGGEGDEQADVDPRPRDRRQHLVEVDHRGLRDVDRRILERPLDQDVGEVDADERHHQRRDDLVRPVARLQERGDDRPGRADAPRPAGRGRASRARAAGRSSATGRSRRRPRRRAGTGRCSRGSRCSRGRSTVRPAAIRSSGAILIALSCQASRRRRDPALPDVAVEGERVAAEREQQDRRRRRARDDRDERADADVEARRRRSTRGRCRRAAIRRTVRAQRSGAAKPVVRALIGRGLRLGAAPTISRPICSAAPGPFATMPTRRPRESTAIRSQISSSSSRSVEITSAAPPPVDELADQVAHGRGRLHVEPVGRLVEDDDLRVEAAARGRAGPSGCCRPRACPVACVDAAACARRTPARARRRRSLDRRPLDAAVPPERPLADALQEEVERRPGSEPTIPSPSRSSVT